MIQLVFAHNGYSFGSHDGMPWPHISKDFENFKERTMNSTLIMGAKTFASLPGILPGRKHIVVCDTERPLPTAKNGALSHQYINKDQLKKLLTQTKVNGDRNLSIIGGVDLLEFGIKYADKIIETNIRISPLDEKETTAWLSGEFLDQVDNFGICKESHFYQIDETSSIVERVLTKE